MTTFDKLAQDYKKSIEDIAPVTGYSLDYFSEYKIKDLKFELEKQNITKQNLEILDFGCGIGLSDPYLALYFPEAKITSCDISSDSVELAKKNNAGIKNVTYYYLAPGVLPEGKKYDVIFLANVMRHVPKEYRFDTLTMLKNALTAEGIIFMYEFNPFNPVSLYAYFKHDVKYNSEDKVQIMTEAYAKKLFKSVGFNDFEINYRFYIPKFLYKFISVEKYLKHVPLGACYYVVTKNIKH